MPPSGRSRPWPPRGTAHGLDAPFGWRAAGHEVAAVEHFGHDAQFPVDRRWQGMTRQLTTLIDGLAEPKLWLVGHSMGGYPVSYTHLTLPTIHSV